VRLAIQKFPGIWKIDPDSLRDSKSKQIIFVKELLEKISDGKIQVTFRKSPKVGFYYVIENRFRQKADSARLLIEFYRTDRVNPYELTDDEALLAGLDQPSKSAASSKSGTAHLFRYSSGIGFEYWITRTVSQTFSLLSSSQESLGPLSLEREFPLVFLQLVP
jgi:hypothetical protein